MHQRWAPIKIYTCPNFETRNYTLFTPTGFNRYERIFNLSWISCTIFLIFQLFLYKLFISSFFQPLVTNSVTSPHSISVMICQALVSQSQLTTFLTYTVCVYVSQASTQKLHSFRLQTQFLVIMRSRRSVWRFSFGL